MNELPCSPTQSHQDEVAAITDIHRLQEYSVDFKSLSDISPAQPYGSYTNYDSFPYPSVDCIPNFMGTPVPDGNQQKQALPRSKSKPQLNLPKAVPPWLDVPRPQPRPRLPLKRTSKVPTSPDVSSQDLPVPPITSGDVYCDSKCTPILSDSKSDEAETCIPSPVVLPDLNDVITCSSEVQETILC